MLKILKAGTSLGSDNIGSELAPDKILKTLSPALHEYEIGHRLLKAPIVRGETPQSKERVRNHAKLTELNRQIYNIATGSKGKDDIVLTLGGDHSISIGSMFGSKSVDSDAVIIYIDAHPDCHSPETSPSGNMHGMSLATVLGDSLYDDYQLPKYKYSEVVLLGAKDIDRGEDRYLADHKIKNYGVRDIVAEGIGQIMKRVIKFAGRKPVHVSLDIDAVDVSEAPGTGIINKGGLTYREVRYITEILSTLNIKSIDLVEVNPSKDIKEKTTELAAELIMSLLGYKWTPYEKYIISI